MRDLTRRQREILEYIISKVRREERFPSYREIGRRFRLSSCWDSEQVQPMMKSMQNAR